MGEGVDDVEVRFHVVRVVWRKVGERRYLRFARKGRDFLFCLSTTIMLEFEKMMSRNVYISISQI